MLKRYIKANILETIRDITSFGSPLTLVILVALIFGINFIFWKIILGLAAVELFGSLIKGLHYKRRPKEETHNNIMERINAGSFPSLHIARSSFIFLMLFFLLNTYLVKVVAVVMILLVGISRIRLKKHYFFDVVVGFLIGLIFSLIWMAFIM